MADHYDRDKNRLELNQLFEYSRPPELNSLPTGLRMGLGWIALDQRDNTFRTLHVRIKAPLIHLGGLHIGSVPAHGTLTEVTMAPEAGGLSHKDVFNVTIAGTHLGSATLHSYIAEMSPDIPPRSVHWIETDGNEDLTEDGIVRKMFDSISEFVRVPEGLSEEEIEFGLSELG